MTKTYYISGPITGMPPEAIATFMSVELELTQKGYAVYNPARLPGDMPQSSYLPICLSMLEKSDAVIMLPGWTRSGGAKIEHAYAQYQGKQVEYLSPEEETAAAACDRDRLMQKYAAACKERDALRRQLWRITHDF